MTLSWWNAIATPLVRMWDWILRILFPPPPPSKPYVIPDDPNQIPTGPNLVQNGSFEFPNVDIGTEQVVQGGGVIQYWLVLQNGGQARWITSSHAVLNKAADGTRFVDLTGGKPAGPGRVLATLYQESLLALQPGQSYEIAVELGVGPNNGPLSNFGPPVSVWIGVIRPPDSVERQFVSNPLNPPTGTGVTWERVTFRFAIPATYVLPPLNKTVRIWGQAGYAFIGVDNVSVRLLT